MQNFIEPRWRYQWANSWDIVAETFAMDQFVFAFKTNYFMQFT